MKNKKLIQKLKEFISAIDNLPDRLVSPEDFKLYYESKDKDEKNGIYKKTLDIYETAYNLQRQIRALVDHFYGESDFKVILNQITFKNSGIIYNFGHYQDDIAFNQDKKILKNLILDMIADFETGKVDSRKKSIFESSLFWTIVSIVATVAFFAGVFSNKLSNTYQTDKFKKVNLELNELLKHKTDSISMWKIKKDSLHTALLNCKSLEKNNDRINLIVEELSDQLSELTYKSRFDYERDYLEWEERTFIILEKFDNNSLIEYYKSKMENIKGKGWYRDKYLPEAKNTLEKILLKLK